MAPFAVRDFSPVRTLKIGIEVQKIADGVVVVLFEQFLHVDLDGTDQFLVRCQRGQLKDVLGQGRPFG